MKIFGLHIMTNEAAAEVREHLKQLIRVIKSQQEELKFLRGYVANLDKHPAYTRVADLDRDFLSECGINPVTLGRTIYEKKD